MKDLSYSARLLRRHPRYTVLAVLTLAVGIGVTAAMFGVLDAVFFRPQSIHAPERLVDITLEATASRFRTVSYQEFLDIQQNAQGLQDAYAIGQRGITLHHNGEARLLLVHYVTGRYFPTLQIPMHLGRGFTEADDRPDPDAPSVIINHHAWQERLGAPADIIGRTIQLNNTRFTVVGVTARGFTGLNRTVRTDVWIPVRQAPFAVPGLRNELENRRQRWFHVSGRLAAGAHVSHVQSALDVLASRWRGADARDYADARLVAQSQANGRREERKDGLVLLTLVGLILLIACANVANLTLARGEGRRREVAVRAALGATRMGLLKQMLIESAVVSLLGGATGLLLANLLIQAIPALLPPDASFMVVDVRMDMRLLTFTLLASAMTMLLIGLVPAWRGSRGDIAHALKGEARSGVSMGRTIQLRDLLVVAEIALSGVVIIAAALLIRSFAYSLAAAPGFDTTRNVSTFYMVPGLKGYDRAKTYQFLEEVRQAIAALPGVRRVSYGIRLPAQGNEAGWSAAFIIPGKEPPSGKDAFDIRYTMVGPGYFDVIGTRILQGRGVIETDRPDAAPVAVISQTMARRLWGDENPIGKRLRMGGQKAMDREIVGVAEDIRIGGLYEAPEMYVYVPFAQHQQEFGLLMVESTVEGAALVTSVRQQIAQIAPAMPILNVSSFGAHMDLLRYEERRNAWIGFVAAFLALALGAIGVYGVVSLAVARRTRELGIRAALGASHRELVRLLLGRGAALAAGGGFLGIVGGVTVGHLLESQLHGVQPADLLSIVVGTLAVASVALVANLVPAWRAARVDPLVALKTD
jgi:predicted permease